MNLKCGYFAVGGIMCGSLVGIFIGALAVNASLGYMILLLGAWGLCLYITSRSLMDDAMTEAMKTPLKAWPTPARRVCGHPRARKKVLSLTTPPAGRCPHLNAAARMGAGLKPRQMQREEGVFL